MKIGDVLADEVIDLVRTVRPPVIIELQVITPGAQIFETGHVTNGRIEPDIEILAWGIRDLEAKIRRIAGDVPGLQTRLEPLIELVGNAALQPTTLGPVAQHALEGAEVKEIMLGLFHHRGGAGDRGIRIFQVSRAIGGTAHLAVIAILIRGAAIGTLALDEPIRQEHLFLRVEILFDLFAVDITAVAQTGIDQFRQLAVLGRVGGMEIIETNVEGGKIGTVFLVGLRDQCLRRDAQLVGIEHDRGAMGVIGTDIGTAVPLHSLEADPYIGLNVFHQVAQMDGAIGVGQGAGDQDMTLRSGHG